MRIVLHVNNLTRVANFYENVLQYTIVNRWSDPPRRQGIIFEAGNQSLIEPVQDGIPHRHSGLGASLRVPNVWKLWERVKRLNVTILFPLRNNSWGDVSFGIADPEHFPLIFFTPVNGRIEGNFFSDAQVLEMRIMLTVKDFYQQEQFYNSTLKLRTIKRWDNTEQKGVMFEAAKQSVIELLTGEHVPYSGALVAIRVDNVWKKWEELKNKVRVRTPLQDNAWGDTSFGFNDLENMQLVYFSPTK